MHTILTYAAYGFLVFGGTMHFLIDVVSQYVRGKRVPGPETTAYFGINTAYALGQIVFGVLALIVARRTFALLGTWPVATVSVLAGVCWLAFAFVYIEYREPRVVMSIFLALLVASLLTR